MERIEVAVGIIENAQGELLVGQRTVKDDYYQKWEFPGGKLEIEEAADVALVRELKEELGITVSKMKPLITLDHDYPDRHVRLFVFRVLEFKGEVSGLEGQATKWVALSELPKLDFLEGNEAIVDRLMLGY